MCVNAHAVPIAGAGRPEACYVLERLADEAALKLGVDRAGDSQTQPRARLRHALQDSDRADLRLPGFSESSVAVAAGR
jgi:hypothetical protein